MKPKHSHPDQYHPSPTTGTGPTPRILHLNHHRSTPSYHTTQVLGDRLFDAHSAQTRTKLVVGLAAVRVKLRLTEAWEASWADFNALLRSVLMFPVVDSAAIMAPLRAPGGAKQGEPRDDAAEAEWNRMQAGAGAAWAGVMATAEQQWAAVTAAGRAQWDAVQAGLRAYFGSHVFGIAWDGVEAWAAAQTAELEKLGAALWAQTSQAARLEGKLLRLGWAAPERWALRRAARGGGGAAGTKARRTLLDEQRAAWERAVETVWADLRTAAKRLCVKIVLQMIDETNDLAATAQHGYQTYTHEWPALGGVAAAADEPPVLEQGQEQEQG